MTMLLQTAILVGDTLKACDPRDWISPDGSCGCAFGGALLATGVTAAEFSQQFAKVNPFDPTWFYEMPCIMSRWPWLTPRIIGIISSLYFGVHEGRMAIEDVAAYVRGVEPIPAPNHQPQETAMGMLVG